MRGSQDRFSLRNKIYLREITHSLKLVDYVLVQADKSLFNYSLHNINRKVIISVT